MRDHSKGGLEATELLDRCDVGLGVSACEMRHPTRHAELAALAQHGEHARELGSAHTKAPHAGIDLYVNLQLTFDSAGRDHVTLSSGKRFDLFGVEDDRRQPMLDQGLEAITSTTVRAAHDQDWPTKTRVTQLDSLFEQCDAHAVDPRLFERRRDD